MSTDELHIRLPADEVATLRQLAAREERSVTAQIRIVIRAGLAALNERLQTPTHDSSPRTRG